MDPTRIDELLERIRGLRVLVIGDLMLDRYISGSVDRISPEAPVPVVRVESERAGVGGAGNVAANVMALGGACAVVGCVGDDADGALLLEALEGWRIACEGVVRTGDRPTTVKTRVLAQHQQVVRYDRETDEDAGPRLEADLARQVRERVRECDVLVVQDYDKGVFAPAVVAAVAEVTRARRLPWVVDPKRRNFFAFEGATLFKPNARELADGVGEAIRADDATWMEATRTRLGCDHLLLTLGDRGMSLSSKGGSFVRLAAVAREVYDVSGAGDTVTAAVALSLAAGATAEEAAVLANHAAAVEVGKSGVQTVSPSEIRSHVRSRGSA